MPPMLRRVDAFARLANVAWSALRSAEVIPVLARVLDGEPAEREIDRFLRARRWYEANERAAAVEAIFGVALWRRRL
ncbi:MAG TPA: RsmB/NOP family class I SAM-dependent RNA methyltransferase, partial [Myxococcales bacterium]|nr:RsmB/NOP family class I SAM-dependent RNA methyltransferase [Myxococcales bacterium]